MKSATSVELQETQRRLHDLDVERAVLIANIQVSQPASVNHYLLYLDSGLWLSLFLFLYSLSSRLRVVYGHHSR
jgi:hypothetical protein